MNCLLKLYTGEEELDMGEYTTPATRSGRTQNDSVID